MTQPSPKQLFAALDATWAPARMLRAGPWMLREGLGGGQRVSAATAEDAVTEASITQAEDGMRDLGQRPLFMIRAEDTELDGWLAARRYDIVDPVTMYIAPSAKLAADLPLTSVIPSWPPLAIQRELWADAGIDDARLNVMDRVTNPKTALLGRNGDTPAACSFIAAHGDIAMLHALEVTRSQRRGGLGRAMMTACANWAVNKNAAWLALAVTTANDAANALYQQLGMTSAPTYHYRRAPEVTH